METWERRDNFNFFRTFSNPSVSITSEVACGGAKARAKAAGESFFLHYLYAILRAANEIKEFRYRIDAQDRVVLYDWVDVMIPVKVNESGKFLSVRIPYDADFGTFYRQAKELIDGVSPDADPYANEKGRNEDTEFNLVNISALPDLYFTAAVTAQQHRNGNDYPLMTVGKAVMREGQLIMPISLSVHHGFVDGYHISLFFKTIEELLK